MGGKRLGRRGERNLVQRLLRQEEFGRMRIGQEKPAPAFCAAARDVIGVARQGFGTLKLPVPAIRPFFIGGNFRRVRQCADDLQ
jgi:hypothetical protein